MLLAHVTINNASLESHSNKYIPPRDRSLLIAHSRKKLAAAAVRAMANLGEVVTAPLEACEAVGVEESPAVVADMGLEGDMDRAELGLALFKAALMS